MLFFKMKGVLFDYGIGEHFAGDPVDFGARRGRIKSVSKSQYEVFALTNVFNSLVLHLYKSMVNRLPLRIEDGLLEGYVDMSLHRARL